MHDDILDLEHEWRNALGWLDDALETAGNLCDDGKGSLNGWTAMAEACGKLGEARRLLAEALAPLADALRQAHEYADEMSDRAWDENERLRAEVERLKKEGRDG